MTTPQQEPQSMDFKGFNPHFDLGFLAEHAVKAGMKQQHSFVPMVSVPQLQDIADKTLDKAIDGFSVRYDDALEFAAESDSETQPVSVMIEGSEDMYHVSVAVDMNRINGDFEDQARQFFSIGSYVSEIVSAVLTGAHYADINSLFNPQLGRTVAEIMERNSRLANPDDRILHVDLVGSEEKIFLAVYNPGKEHKSLDVPDLEVLAEPGYSVPDGAYSIEFRQYLIDQAIDRPQEDSKAIVGSLLTNLDVNYAMADCYERGGYWGAAARQLNSWCDYTDEVSNEFWHMMDNQAIESIHSLIIEARDISRLYMAIELARTSRDAKKALGMGCQDQESLIDNAGSLLVYCKQSFSLYKERVNHEHADLTASLEDISMIQSAMNMPVVAKRDHAALPSAEKTEGEDFTAYIP
ncbi:hypothetical protein GF345_05025 [Candidatus Woesearchaeota archaeon]|nr:hypothetical protein [Candidatus Woesearchaeota archaeon]